ncbi:MAG: DUF1566 domain-containing protein [Sulfurovum sp.]|nr:DUF1566 domain-containing protein [Sulfurovum sp.]
MVTDQLTGLEWADDANVSSVTKQWLTTDNYNICIANQSDPACYDTNSTIDPSDDTATEYCDALALGGHEDWRLPTSVELEGIVHHGKISPSIDTRYFKQTSSNRYWSSSTYEGYKNFAWYVSFRRWLYELLHIRALLIMCVVLESDNNCPLFFCSFRVFVLYEEIEMSSEKLPIFRKALALCVYIESIVKGFDRYHKYTIGKEMREFSQSLIFAINKAGLSKDRVAILTTLRDKCEALKMLLLIAKEIEAFKSFKQFEHSSKLCVNVCRQSQAWLNASVTQARISKS